ncbi:hypothetical protein BY996DRAFT_8397035 [Phakopsora pachyrhizi]|nr:hypothetical protein BY996DRAFT_8397035 [Phakopsora pachyrhizi]
MAFLEAELHLFRDQLGTFELRMRAIELGNEKAASSTSAIAQSIEIQASEYYYLRKKSSTSSSKGPISRYSNQPEVKDHALSAHQSSGSDNHTNEPNFGLFDQDGVVMMMGRVLIVVGECYPIDSGDLGD